MSCARNAPSTPSPQSTNVRTGRLEFDAALDALEVAVAARDPGVWIVVSGTAGNAIRSMTAWQALCAQLGLSSGRSPDSG